MDGARAVFQRLGQPDDLFESLKGLRNGLAHGYVSLVDAVRIASNNIELVRKTLVVMILRILKCDEKIIAQVADQIAYKGKFAPYYKHVGTIRLRPGSVSDFENQPLIEMQCDAVHTERAGDKLNFSPTLNFTLKKGDSLNGRGYEIWGDVAGGLTIEGPTEVNVVSGSENKRSNPGIRT